MTRLTSPEYLSHHPYFHNNLFTKDSKNIIYTMEKCGLRDFYVMNIKNGVSIQLTEGGGICDFSANLSSDDKSTIEVLNEDKLTDNTGWNTFEKMGRILDRKDYTEESLRQFLVHIKYLRIWTFIGIFQFAP